jgi:glycerol-3-phosphate dehydrogenase (NAD(P)+)
VGARPDTVTGLGGAGDLHVTGVAGRNRIFGELRGAGVPTREVVARLRARDELTEGYAAIRWSFRFAAAEGVTGTPLLRALYRIVYQGRDVERELRAACFPQSTPTQGGTS